MHVVMSHFKTIKYIQEIIKAIQSGKKNLDIYNDVTVTPQ